MSYAREARWAKKKEARAERKEAKYHNKAVAAAMRGKMCRAACLENKAQKMHIRAEEARQRHDNATRLLQARKSSYLGHNYSQTIPVQVQYLPGGTTVQTGAALLSVFNSSPQTTQYQPTRPIQPFSYPPQQAPPSEVLELAPQGDTPTTDPSFTYPPQGETQVSPELASQGDTPTTNPYFTYPPQGGTHATPEQPPPYPGTSATSLHYPAEPPPAYTP